MLIDDNSDDEKEKDSRMKVSEDVMDEVSNLQRMFHSFKVLEVENETTIFEAMAKSPVYAEAVSKKTRMLGHSGFEFKFEVGFQLWLGYVGIRWRPTSPERQILAPRLSSKTTRVIVLAVLLRLPE